VNGPRLRVGVPVALLELEPVGGHGKVRNRVLPALGLEVTVVPIGRPSRRSARLRAALAGRASGAIDVVLADGHGDLPDVRAPLVVQVHEAGWFDPELRALLNPQFLANIEPRTERAIWTAAHVITPSESARRDIIAGYGVDPDRVHGIHHGVDRCFTPDAGGGAGRAIVAGAAGHDCPYVLYTATLHPRKNLAVLRDAMAVLASRGLPQLLAIAGHPAPDRPDSAELERAAAAELPGAPGRVAWLGSPTDEQLAALMADADAFCLPSLYEGFGLTALEAMACGAPVVVSDRGALPEVVDGAGVVVEPSAEAIAAALESVLTDARRAARLRAAALARAGEFTWERTAQGWLSVLRAAAADS